MKIGFYQEAINKKTDGILRPKLMVKYSKYEKVKPIDCKICSKSFKSLRSYIEHYTNNHLN